MMTKYARGMHVDAVATLDAILGDTGLDRGTRERLLHGLVGALGHAWADAYSRGWADCDAGADPDVAVNPYTTTRE